MSPVLRAVFVWLLMLAIPVQGYAGIAMLACGPGHEAAATAGHHDADASSVHHGTEASAHAHHDMADAPDAAEFDHAAKLTCSACASCCAAPALPTVHLPVSLPATVDRPAATVVSSLVLFMTDGPERPPRSTCA